jgi:hypothetical protein
LDDGFVCKFSKKKQKNLKEDKDPNLVAMKRIQNLKKYVMDSSCMYLHKYIVKPNHGEEFSKINKKQLVKENVTLNKIMSIFIFDTKKICWLKTILKLLKQNLKQNLKDLTC